MDDIFWFADGVGDVGGTATTLVRWIRTQSPALIVYGGDVYGDGTDEEFGQFLAQVDGQVSDLCEVPGNHDWETRSETSATGEIPSGYEAFWSARRPPNSQQPIDTTKKGGARYEHFKDIGGWRLIFLDTGLSKRAPWPVGDPSRVQFLKNALAVPGRAKIVFTHHSRLSRGKHGDVTAVSGLWEALFDSSGTPLVALTVGGHDHNVSLYNPRPRNNPGAAAVPFAKGVHVLVNGAGGNGHDLPTFGSTPEFKDTKNFAVTRIRIVSPTQVDVSIHSFGPNNPPRVTTPTEIKTLTIQV